MAFDEGLTQRLREIFQGRLDVVEKRMFGGIAFLLSGNMCCGVVNDMLVVRVGPDAYEEALKHPDAREMDFTGKPLRGFLYIGRPGFSEDDRLRGWVDRCEAFTRSLPPKSQIHRSPPGRFGRRVF